MAYPLPSLRALLDPFLCQEARAWRPSQRGPRELYRRPSPPTGTVPGLPWAGERVSERTLAQSSDAGPQRGLTHPAGCVWSRGGRSEVAPCWGLGSPAERPLGHFSFPSDRPQQDRRCQGGCGVGPWIPRAEHSAAITQVSVDVRLSGMSARRGHSARRSQGWVPGRSDGNTRALGLGRDAAFGPRLAAGFHHVLCPYL